MSDCYLPSHTFSTVYRKSIHSQASMDSLRLRPLASLLLISLSLLPPFTLALDTGFIYCDESGENYDSQVLDVDISPFPVLVDQATNFTVSATAGSIIYKGNVTIDILELGSIVVKSESYALCTKLSCPITGGDNFTILHTMTFSKTEFVADAYTVKMKLRNFRNVELTCIEFPLLIFAPVAES